MPVNQPLHSQVAPIRRNCLGFHGARLCVGQVLIDDPDQFIAVVIGVTVPKALAEWLDVWATKHAMTRSAAVTEAVRRLVGGDEPPLGWPEWPRPFGV